jgi:hypothetical protein
MTTIDDVKTLALELDPASQYELAQHIASNVGYVLAPEPPHPDSPHQSERQAAAFNALVEALSAGPVGWQWRPHPDGDNWCFADAPDVAELRKHPDQFRPLNAQLLPVDFSLAKQLRLSITRNGKLLRRLVTLLTAIRQIHDATLDGRICDDVAWSPHKGETLHDYCEHLLEVDANQAQADLFSEPGR